MMNRSDKILLEVKNLCTHFQTDDGLVKAVEKVDLDIRPGETLGLVGESGCGKSVTALSIMRLIPEPPGRIVSGRISLEGQNLLELTEPQMRRIRGNAISMIFQEPMTSLNPVHRIGAQVAEAIRLHQGVGRKEARSRALEVLDKVGIPDPSHRYSDYPFQLSGGMRQRVMIAMALSCHPKLVIADEPSTALDVTIQAQILTLMRRLKEDTGASILLITHDLGVIAEAAERVAVMYAGRVVESAMVIPLFNEPKHPYTQGLMLSVPKMDKPVPADKLLKSIPGVVPNLLELPPGCPFQERCDQVIPLCSQDEPPLVDTGENHWVRCWQYG
jgi:oligopeptide/dipeptide ABC transporter ATP-binding protein